MFAFSEKVSFRYDLGALAYQWLGENISEDKKALLEEDMLLSKAYSELKEWDEETIKKGLEIHGIGYRARNESGNQREVF